MAACISSGVMYYLRSDNLLVAHSTTVAKTEIELAAATVMPTAPARQCAGTSLDRYTGETLVRMLMPISKNLNVSA